MNPDILKKAGFEKELNRVKDRKCPSCGNRINSKEFKDNLSIKEFTISGLCQKCQDEIFKEDDVDEVIGPNRYNPKDRYSTSMPINSKTGNFMKTMNYDSEEMKMKKGKNVINNIREDTTIKPEKSAEREEKVDISDVDIDMFKNIVRDLGRISNVTSKLIDDVESEDGRHYDEYVQKLKRTFEPLVVTMQRLPDSKNDLGKEPAGDDDVTPPNENPADLQKNTITNKGDTELDKAIEKEKGAGKEEIPGEDDERIDRKNTLKERKTKGTTYVDKVAMKTRQGRIVWVKRDKVPKYIAKKGYSIASGAVPRSKRKKSDRPKKPIKSLKMNEYHKQFYGGDVGVGKDLQNKVNPKQAIQQSICSKCLQKVDQNKFRDFTSAKEYKIRGICQDCQDKMYGMFEVIDMPPTQQMQQPQQDKIQNVRQDTTQEKGRINFGGGQFAVVKEENNEYIISVMVPKGQNIQMNRDKSQLLAKSALAKYTGKTSFMMSNFGRSKYTDSKDGKSLIATFSVNKGGLKELYTGAGTHNIMPQDKQELIDSKHQEKRVIMRATNGKTYAVRASKFQKYMDNGFTLEKDTVTQMPKTLRTNEAYVINRIIDEEINKVIKEVAKKELKSLKKHGEKNG